MLSSCRQPWTRAEHACFSFHIVVLDRVLQQPEQGDHAEPLAADGPYREPRDLQASAYRFAEEGEPAAWSGGGSRTGPGPVPSCRSRDRTPGSWRTPRASVAGHQRR